MTDDVRTQILTYTSRMMDLTPGKSGNYGVRSEQEAAVTPSGIAYDELTRENVPVLPFSKPIPDREVTPTSEWSMYQTLFVKMEVNAIVHAHSPWATTASTLVDELPPIHYVMGLAGERLPVCEYELYGTEAHARNVFRALESTGSKACLISNHGLVACGDCLESAFDRAEAVEFTAQVYCRAQSTGRDPRMLTEEQIRNATEKLSDYGQ